MDPGSLDEYNRKYNANMKIEGVGVDTATTFPCVGCAEPGFLKVSLADFENKAMKEGATCSSCGRSFKVLFTVETDSRTEAMWVQTGGPDMPSWMPIKIRRV